MKRLLACVCLSLATCVAAFPQQDTSVSTSSNAVVPRLIRFSGQVKGATGTVGITFSLHKSQQDSTSLWIETQNVKLDADGKYNVLLGSQKAIPVELFSAAAAQWLSIHVENQAEQRVLLVSVPYALKAAEAETIGGHNATDFVTTDKLTTVVKQELKVQKSSTDKPGATTNNVGSYVDSNATQVLTVTQNGTGVAINATAANDYAVKANSPNWAIVGRSTNTTGATYGVVGTVASTGGTAIRGSATSTTGGTYGVSGTSASPIGYGVSGQNTATTGNAVGLYGKTASSAGLAVRAQASSATAHLFSGTGSANSEIFYVDGLGNVYGKTGYFSGYPDGNSYSSIGIIATGSSEGTTANTDGGAGGNFTGGSNSGSSNSNFAGNGINGYGGSVTGDNYAGAGVYGAGGSGANGNGTGTQFAGYGVRAQGGNNASTGSIYYTGGYGVYSQGGSSVATNALGGVGVRAIGGQSTNGTGGTGLVAEGGYSPLGKPGWAASFGYGGVSVNELTGNGAGILLGRTGCGAGFAGITLSIYTNTNCTDYNILGDGTSTYLNRTSGGKIYFREGNTTQMYIASGGDVTVNQNLNVGLSATVTGTLTAHSIVASIKNFAIDHPLDPANKLLYHTSIESPDMKDLYDGMIELDAKGEAWVTLPNYFEALNQDFRYTLTAVGRSAPNLYIAKKVDGNKFKISGGKPHMEVSWQVTGIRHDAYANAYRGPVEVEKSVAQKGKYLSPELFGASPEQAMSPSPTQASVQTVSDVH
ncbi:hypothetical protein Acid345_2744 [Candidatus Koribacter versatilis Ellin345]|uniref:Uncharacterized protein n=1 Tax=Koribacter versatilis (strain Ellin345) TaxID=204669 RepID=Q1IN05_KORVE|nr:hypothetical protein [Candidatus Koribacter versatilis]ABF41745.1 hypothetical protein Acid345_2744 [Candidatus Koribacter versatilis Ellin345]